VLTTVELGIASAVAAKANICATTQQLVRNAAADERSIVAPLVTHKKWVQGLQLTHVL